MVYEKVNLRTEINNVNPIFEMKSKIRKIKWICEISDETPDTY